VRAAWRAYSLASLAVEEVGKAGSLAALAAMPENLRARALIGRLLAWHQLKLVKGMLTAHLPFGAPNSAARFASMPPSELAVILDYAQAFAEDTDRLKQRGPQCGRGRQRGHPGAVRGHCG